MRAALIPSNAPAVLLTSHTHLNNNYEKSTDTIIHIFDAINGSIKNKIIINNLYDVHQITQFLVLISWVWMVGSGSLALGP